MARIKDLDQEMDNVLKSASVSTPAAEKKEELFDTPVRNIPVKFRTILKANGYTVGGYIKAALRRCMIQDGLIDN